jgi:hypothetical protein
MRHHCSRLRCTHTIQSLCAYQSPADATAGTTTPAGTAVQDSSDVCVFILDVRTQQSVVPVPQRLRDVRMKSVCLRPKGRVSLFHRTPAVNFTFRLLTCCLVPGGVRCSGPWSSIRGPTVSSHQLRDVHGSSTECDGTHYTRVFQAVSDSLGW